MLRPATLLKKRLWHRCFPVNFAKFLKTPFLTEHFQWLLLKNLENLKLTSYSYSKAHYSKHVYMDKLNSMKSLLVEL